MRLKAVSAANALDGTGADADGFGHQGGGPVSYLGRWIGLGECYDALGDLRSKRRNARRSCLVAQEAVVTFLHEAVLPAPDTGLRLAGLAHDLIGADALGAQQHDLGSPHVLLRCVTIPRKRLQTTAVTGSGSDGNSGSHRPDSHAARPAGIPSRIQMSD